MISESDVWDALPSHGFLRAYVEYASRCTDANAAYHVAGALACLSQCVPDDYAVPYTSPVHAPMYIMVVGGSSKSRKTASISIAQRLIRDAIPDALAEVPGSVEGLYEGLREKNRQIIIYGEWGEFLAKAEEGYLMALKTAYTSVWDGLPAGRALAKQRKGPIEKPRLSMLCGVATDLLERHTEQADWTGGFLARFATFFAEPEREFATPPIDDYDNRLRMTQWLADLANPMHRTGRSLWLDDQAQAMWADWYDGLRPLIETSSRKAAAACSRASSIAAKITLLLAWDIGEARSGGPWRVSIHDLEPALKITNLHLQSVLELGERITGSRDMRDRANVLRAIQMVPTPLGVVLREAEMLKRRAKEIIDSLVEEKAIAEVKINNQLYYKQTPEAQNALVQALNQAKLDQQAAHQVVAEANLARVSQVFSTVPVDRPVEDDEAAYWASFEG